MEQGSKEWVMDHDLFSDVEEQRVIFAALDSFRQYRKTAHYNVTHRRRQNFYALPSAQWQMLAAPPFNILENLEHVDDAIDANADIASFILESALQAFGIDAEPKKANCDWRGAATSSDLDKARSTIRQLYRDWSAEGAVERDACYVPVLEAIDKAFGMVDDKSSVHVLVPGAGLGRLVFECCKRGYTVEGNEISYHQLAASNWVLNCTSAQHELYPFALDFSNVVSRTHQLSKVLVPDIHAGSELGLPNEHSSIAANERMNMTAADFLVLYSDREHREMFDAVVTVFFVDTAPNVIRYIETIHACLKDGGIWVNLGPLLWHFADRGPGDMPPAPMATQKGTVAGERKMGIEEAGSFELSNEELLLLIEKMGFRLEHTEIRSEWAGYAQNRESMLQNEYRTSYWVAKKTAAA